MAHEIETHGTEAAAIFAREDAWHKLGTTMPAGFTAEEAMTVGKLGGWNVRKLPVTMTDITDDGVTSVEVPGQFAIARTNPWTGAVEPLGGVVGAGYTPIQNEEHCELLNALVEESGAHFESAGSLRGGSEVFVTMRMPEAMTVGGVDRVDLYIAALNNHIGRAAFRLLVTPVRVVCANTQAAALGNNVGMFSIRHTANARQAINEAREQLGLAFKYAEEFETEAERMIQETMTDGQFREIMMREWGPLEDMGKRAQDNAQQTVDHVFKLWSEADTQAAIRNTRWAAYQAVTEYVDHFIPVRGAGDEATVRAERVLTSADLPAIKRHAFDLFRVPA